MTLAGGRGEIVQPGDLVPAQVDSVGCRVLLDPGDPLGAGDRGNIVALREEPGQSDLRRCGVHNTGVKRFHHPVVGELSLSYNRLDLPADHGLTIFTYAAEPGSRSAEGLKLLGSWAATVDSAESTHATNQS